MYLQIQFELNKRREADYLKLRREYEETVLQSDAALSSLKKKHSDMVSELTDQVSIKSAEENRKLSSSVLANIFILTGWELDTR